MKIMNIACQSVRHANPLRSLHGVHGGPWGPTGPQERFLVTLTFSIMYFDGKNVRFIVFLPVLVLDKQMKSSVDASFD